MRSGRRCARTSAALALLHLAVFVLLVAILHLLRRDDDVRFRHLSEYAVGSHGWVMEVAFLAAGVAITSLAVGLGNSLAPSRPLRIGSILMVCAGVTNGVMALVRTDLSAPSETGALIRTNVGRVHDLLAAVHALLWLANPILITAAIWRDRRWSSHARASLAATVVEILFLVVLLTLQRSLPGIGQRLWVAALVGWCALHAGMLRSEGRALL